MSLIKLSENTYQNVNDITYTGFTTAYDIHVMKIRRIRTTQVNGYLDARFTQASPSAGTPITTTNYDYAGWYDHSGFSVFPAMQTSANQSYTDKWRFSYISQNNAGDGYYYELWIYNAASSSDKTRMTFNSVGWANGNAIANYHGGVSLDETTAVDGIQIFTQSGVHQIAEADITLYGLKES